MQRALKPMRNQLSELAKVEAALYASGRPLSVDDLIKITGVPKTRVRSLLTELERNVRGYSQALELVQVRGDLYALRLKQDFVYIAKRSSLRPVISKAVLKTLTMVAYYQPISSLDLSLRRGTQVYGHLKLLESLGYVRHEVQNRRHYFYTTPYFSSYFGVPDDREGIKRKLSSLFKAAH